MTVEGIAVHEYWLLIYFFSILFIIIILLGACFFLLRLLRFGLSKKERKRLERLKSETDERYIKRHEREKRKLQRKKKRVLMDELFEYVILTVSLGLTLFAVFSFLMPVMQDYVKKDYVVYSGKPVEVDNQHGARNSSTLVLEDGTHVSYKGVFDFSEDDDITIVYSKRTKLYLGGEVSD